LSASATVASAQSSRPHAHWKKVAIPRRDKQPEPIATFECWISPTKSGILVGQGAQIKLEASEDQKTEYLKLAAEGQAKMLYATFFEAPPPTASLGP